MPESEVAPPPHPESASIDALPARSRVSGFEVPDDVRRDMLSGFDRAHTQATARVTATCPTGGRAQPTVHLVAQRRHRFVVGVVGATRASKSRMVRLERRGALGRRCAGSVRSAGLSSSGAGESIRLSASPMGRYGRSRRERHASLARQHSQRAPRSCNPTRCFVCRSPTASAAASAAATSSRASTWANRRHGCLRRASAPMSTLQILDPGKNAEGFEVDVCLRGVGKRISCANDAAAQTKP